MYLAQATLAGQLHYLLRESVPTAGGWTFRELVDLGPDPGRHLIYPGGRSYLLAPELTAALEAAGVVPDDEALENLLWLFLRPEVRRALAPFRHRRRPLPALTPAEEQRLAAAILLLDRRRLAFLRHGRLDLSRIGLEPMGPFRQLADKSRDELEQFFLFQEVRLPVREYKAYVYAAFNLQRFFASPYARTQPQLLSPDELDAVFLAELAAVNRDPAFWMGPLPGPFLHPYLVRHAIQFFDYEFPAEAAEARLIREFMARHRRLLRPAPKPLAAEEAERLFGVSGDELARLSRRQLQRLYKERAHALHPDKGGDHDLFIRLTEAYRALIRRKHA
ncbi:MAG: hypothetical protein AB1634_04015 [Thermodesulfobacteriota bacterium]